MPKLNERHISVLAPLIDPFERSPTKSIERDLHEGEKENIEFLSLIHDGIDNNDPFQYKEITLEELETHKILEGNSYRPKCFLWIIDNVSIKIIWEGTTNYLRSSINKPFVCHTNITGCAKAYIGGEMYFCEDGNIYVNFKSDRYGRPETEDKRKMAVEYMEYAGYKNIRRTKDLF
ncbi:MAG: hypothetical protein IPH33_16265 [Bacteroidetes bacterium]|nr:hypothetical protein [Bacteroidota bacterium]